MMKSSALRSLGYTMLELLLVLSLMAVMTLASIRWHRQHAFAETQKQATGDMQSMIASLMYYESVENVWPDALACDDETSLESDAKFTKYYLPSGIMPSVYGSNYCWQEKEKDSTQAVGLLALNLPIQGEHASSNAQAIAALLPHATAVSDIETLTSCDSESATCYVHTELVPQSGLSSQASGMTLQGMGSCYPDGGGLNFCHDGQPDSSGKCCLRTDTDSTTYTIQLPSCPVGYTLDVAYVPAYIKMATQLHESLSTPSPMSMFDSGYLRDTSFHEKASSLIDRDPEKAVCHDSGDGHSVCDLPVGVGYYSSGKGVADVSQAPRGSGYLRGAAGAVYLAACKKEAV